MTDDRIKSGLAAFVQSLFPRTKYLGRFPSKVVAQNADGTLELKPDDPDVPAPSKVRIRLGIPGSSCKVQAGGYVLLGFDGGDPARPFAELWDVSATTTVIELRIGSTSGVEKVALGETLQTFLSTLRTWLDTHTHIGNLGAPTGPASAGTSGPSPSAPTITSAVVKVST